MAVKPRFQGKRRLTGYVLALVIMSLSGLSLLTQHALAQQLTLRSIAVSTATVSAPTTHDFKFTYVSVSSVASVAFEYCDNSPLPDQPCNAPPGLDLTSATLSSQSGNTGFAIDAIDTTANKLVLSRVPAAAIATPSEYVFTGFNNPSAPARTQFIRIFTYPTADGSGPFTDNGSVAYATVDPFLVGAFVPPFLSFCVGITVASNCSSALGNSIDLGDLSPGHASSAQSQFAAGTNDPSGFNIYSLGTTMTSGNNTIPQLNSPSPSVAGTSQFGINLRANSSPSVGQDPSGTGTATPTANYNIPNSYMFSDGDNIATSALPSDFNRMTVAYLVNVSPAQSPGVYSTTLTYVAVVQF
jgi:hypothetical protein